MRTVLLRCFVFLFILSAGIMTALSQKESPTTPQKETPAPSSQKPSGADVANGKAVYTKACLKCHAADGSGNAAIAKMMKVPLRPLGSPEVQAKNDDQLLKESVQGVGKMKAIPLSDKDGQDVLAYLRSLKEKGK